MVGLIILVPVSTHDRVDEENRIDEVNKFFYSKETINRLGDLGIDTISDEGYQLNILERKDKLYKAITSMSDNPLASRPDVLIGKGDLLTAKIERIRKEFLVKKLDPKEYHFVLIDGSGKINFKYFLNLVEHLIGGNGIVLACRGKDYNLSGDERELIERFENSLVEEKYCASLPDCQCGCWGFRLDLLEKIKPMCNGYEIELDMLTEYMRERLFINFIKVESEKGKSDFNEDAHINKMFFLMTKLKFSKNFVIQKAKNFDYDGTKLSDRYIKLLQDLDWPKIEECDKDQYHPFHPGHRYIPACLDQCDVGEGGCVCTTEPKFPSL